MDTLATDAIPSPAHNISHYTHSDLTTTNTSFKRQITHSITLDLNAKADYVATDKSGEPVVRLSCHTRENL
jgi:hypothetical protein